MKIKIDSLVTGTEVGIWGCRGWFKIIRRIRKNVYLVNFRGKEIEIPRVQLMVRPAWSIMMEATA
jgi:hypothetical protein